MGIEKLGLTLAERCAKYAKACGKRCILETSAPIFNNAKRTITYVNTPNPSKITEIASKSTGVQENLAQKTANIINTSFEQAKLVYPEQVESLLKETTVYCGKIRPRFSEKDIANFAPIMHDEPEIFNYLLNETKISPFDGKIPRFNTPAIINLIPTMKTNPTLTKEIIKIHQNAYGCDIADLIKCINKNQINNTEFLKLLHKTRPYIDREIPAYNLYGLKYLTLHMQEYSLIKDKTILEEVDRIINSGDYNRADALVDAINNITRNYCTLCSKIPNNKTGQFLNQENYVFAKYLRSKGTTWAQFENGELPEDISNILTKRTINSNILLKDFELDCKYRSMNRYIKQYPQCKMSNYLYENYYLQDLREAGIKEEVILRCQEISKKYNIKVMPSTDSYGPLRTLDALEAEINKWIKASNGKAKLPPVIEFSSANKSWYDAEAAYGQGMSGGYSEFSYKGAIALPRMRNIAISDQKNKILRHELTHTNDLHPPIDRIKENYKIEEIMPFHEGLNQRGNKVRINEPQNGKYYQEFVNAGLDDYKIAYAYNNTKEFIAVASEGEMSKYSPEFRRTLINFGMPEWLLNIEG